MLPLVPVTVMVDVEPGTAKPVPLPHPVNAAAPAITTVSNTMASGHGSRRRRRSHSKVASEARPGSPPDCRFGTVLESDLSAGTVTVMVLVAGLKAPGTTLPAEKLTEAPAGRPLAESETALVNGLSAAAEVSWMV